MELLTDALASEMKEIFQALNSLKPSLGFLGKSAQVPVYSSQVCQPLWFLPAMKEAQFLESH